MKTSFFNSLIEIKNKTILKVEIILIDILIPSIPCKEVKIIRTFDIKSKKENLEILIVEIRMNSQRK